MSKSGCLFRHHRDFKDLCRIRTAILIVPKIIENSLVTYNLYRFASARFSPFIARDTQDFFGKFVFGQMSFIQAVPTVITRSLVRSRFISKHKSSDFPQAIPNFFQRAKIIVFFFCDAIFLERNSC
jgi:hypothetical protein